MSINKKNFGVSVSLCFGFLIGFGVMKYYQQNHVASEANFASKSPVFKPLPMGKHHLLTSVKIQTPDHMPADDGEEVKLVGYITLHQEIDRPLFWEWHLPEGVQVISGELKNYEINPLAGHTYTVEIVVRHFSKTEKRIISLQGYVEYETSRVGNSYAVSSDPESSFEYIASSLKAEVDADKAAAPAEASKE